MQAGTPPDFAISKRLTAWRQTQGISAQNLSYKLGLSRNAWSHYEHGKALPQAAHLAKLATLYQVDLNFLLTGTPCNPPPSACAQAAQTVMKILAHALAADQHHAEHTVTPYKSQAPAPQAAPRPLPVAQAQHKTRGLP